MQLSQQTVESGRASQSPLLRRIRRNRRLDRLVIYWDTTPGRLRVTQVLLVFGILLSGGVAGYTGYDRIDATAEIASSIEPLNSNVTTLYRSLADADATVASGFLAGGVEPGKVRDDYDTKVAEAAANLAKAGSRGGDDPMTADRIADLSRRLPVYTGLVEQAHANNRQELPVGVAYLRRASELMQSSILPEAEALRREQADRLDDAYQRAGATPVLALAVGAVSLAGLIWAQIFLFRRTRRVFNVGLVAATGAVLVGLLSWTVAGVKLSGDLQDSLGHSQAVSGALAPAQIAALQARAIESVALVARNGDASEPDFDAKMTLVSRDVGGGEVGGALGAARKLATDQQSHQLVNEAIGWADRYREAHKNIQKLDKEKGYSQAVDFAIDDAIPDSAAATFARLDEKLADAVAHERWEFQIGINGPRHWLTMLVVGTGVLAVAAAVGVALGIRRRLEEYR